MLNTLYLTRKLKIKYLFVIYFNFVILSNLFINNWILQVLLIENEDEVKQYLEDKVIARNKAVEEVCISEDSVPTFWIYKGWD